MFVRRSSNPSENFVLSSIHIRGIDRTAVVENDMMYLEIYETLDGFMSGTVCVIDTIGLVDSLFMTGFEAIDIEFASGVGESYNHVFSKHFRVTNVVRSQATTGNRETLIINFQNNMNIVNDYDKKPFVFKRMSISNMVKTILDGLSETPLYEIEDTIFQRDFISPISKPIDTIFKLTEFASSRDNNSCKYMFYENRDAVQFKSIGSMREQDYEFVIRKGAFTGAEKFSHGESKLIIAHNIAVEEQSDIDQLKSGLYGSRVITHSLINKKLTTSTINRSQYVDEMSVLNDVPHMYTNPDVFPAEIPEPDQPLNSIQFGSEDGFYANENQHALGNMRGVGYMEETYIHAKKIIVEIPGNTNITVGDCVYVDYTGISHEAASSILASGKWIVNKIRHRLEPSEYHSTLELISDSSPVFAISGDD